MKAEIETKKLKTVYMNTWIFHNQINYCKPQYLKCSNNYQKSPNTAGLWFKLKNNVQENRTQRLLAYKATKDIIYSYADNARQLNKDFKPKLRDRNQLKNVEKLKNINSQMFYISLSKQQKNSKYRFVLFYFIVKQFCINRKVF